MDFKTKPFPYCINNCQTYSKGTNPKKVTSFNNASISKAMRYSQYVRNKK
jgi:hypothetical protein